MASEKCHTSVNENCTCEITLHIKSYENVQFGIMEGLCIDAILGFDFLNRHQGLHISLNGDLPPVFLNNLCAVAAVPVSPDESDTTLKIVPPRIFSNLSKDIKPIACKSRRYSQTDKQSITETIQDWLRSGKIEPSSSPWRAQPLVVGGYRH